MGKAQGAIEYLLIIAAAILIVAIVIIALTGALGSGTDQLENGATNLIANNPLLDLLHKATGNTTALVTLSTSICADADETKGNPTQQSNTPSFVVYVPAQEIKPNVKIISQIIEDNCKDETVLNEQTCINNQLETIEINCINGCDSKNPICTQ